MAKKLDDSLFEDVPYEVPEMDDSLFEDVPYSESEETSTIEAMARGAAQGLTFDFADELQAAIESMGKDVGSALGITEPVEGEEPVTFDEQGRPIIPESSGKEYRKRLKEIREQYKKAAEESPVAYYGSDIAAGIVPALFTGGASAATGIGKAVAKGSSKSLLKQGLKAGAIGAGMGAATGAGVSEAEVLDGDISGLAKDVAIGTGTGAVLGAATPALTKAGGMAASKTGGIVKEVLEAVPGVEAVQKGYKAGTKGIKLSQEGIRSAIKEYSEDLHSKMVKKLTKEGMDKKNAIEIADELGVRIDAGESIEAVMKDLSEKGAVNLDDLKDKKALYTVLEDLVNGNDQTIKAIKKLEVKTAKQAARDKYAYGAEAKTTRELEDEIPELLPLTEEKGIIKGLEANMRIPSQNGEATEYAIRNFVEMVDGPIKLRNFDINNLKPSDVEDIIATINKHAGDLTGPAKGPVEKEARRVAAMLRDLSNKALEEFDVSSKNASITNMLRALRKTGIKGKLRGSEEAIKDQIDKIRKKISATGESSEIDKERMFEYLGKVGPEFSESIEQGKFLNELNKLSGMTEGVRTTNIKGLIGTAEGAVAKLSNLAGRAVKTAKPVTKAGSTVANKVMDTSDDVLIATSNRLLSSENKALATMGQQLEYALQQEDPIKNALIWSLSQQPAFRKEVQKDVEEFDDDMMQDLNLQESSEGRSLTPEDNSIIPFRPEQEEGETVGRGPASVEDIDQQFILGQEGFETEGYVPVKGKGSNYTSKSGSGEIAGNSGVTVASGLDLGQRSNLDDLKLSQKIKDKLSPYLGLKKKEAVKKLKELPLVLTEEEAILVKEATEEAYYNKTEDKFNTNPFGKKFDDLPAEVQTALYSLVYNTGTIGPNTLEKASNDNDYSDLIEELKNYYPKDSSADKGFQGERRRAEARYIEDVQKAKDREKKQLGSGAIPGTERSSLDDLMNRLNELRGSQDEQMVAEMEDSAMGGNMNRLQELIDRLKMA